MLRAITDLFTGKPFEFYTPYDLQEFDILLALLSERDHLKYPSWQRATTALQISSRDTGKHSIDFTGHRETTAKFQIDVDGHIEASEDGAYIVGDVKLRKVKRMYTELMLVFAIFSVAIASILMTRQPAVDSILIGLVTFGMFLGGATIELMLTQHKVYNQIYHGLGKPKKRKNT